MKTSKITFLYFLLILFISCKKEEVETVDKKDNTCINGKGEIKFATYNFSHFSGVNLNCIANVSISQGTQNVRVTGHPNIISELKMPVENSTLYIKTKNNCYKEYQLSIDITVPNLKHLTLNSSGNVYVENFYGQENLDFKINGSGSLTLNKFDTPTNISASLGGSGSFTANQKIITPKLTVTNRGSGHFYGFLINSSKCTVTSAGSGNTEVTATSSLDATIKGSGDIAYKGKPAIQKEVLGSGEIYNAN